MTKKIGIGLLNADKIDFVRELTSAEIELYNLNSKSLIEANKSSWIFKILKMNYLIFMEETYKDFENIDFKIPVPWEIMEEKSILINKRFGSFISSFASYNDHTRTYLSRTFGKNSTELQEFNDATKIHFENNFGYRFFCKGLRDYSIHCGIPLVSINIKYNNLEKIVTLLFDRDELLKNWDWKKLIKPELENMPQYFQVTNLVYEAMKSTEEINEILLLHNNKLIDEATKNIQENFQLINNQKLKSCLLIWNENEKIENAKIGQIPFHLMNK